MGPVHCQLMTWAELAYWTGRLAPVVLVGREQREGWWGSQIGRTVRYAAVAPACTVPHELAHWSSRDRDHGPAWRAAYGVWCVRFVQAVDATPPPA